MTGFGKFLFVFTAYAPLWLLIGLRFFVVEPTKADHQLSPVLGWSFCMIAIIAAAIFAPMLQILKRANPTRIHVKSYFRKDEHILSYAVTYFPPLFSINLGSYIDLGSIFIIYLTVFAVYVRLDAYYVNPLFAITGYRIYEVTCEQDNAYTVLVKGSANIRVGGSIRGPHRDGVILI